MLAAAKRRLVRRETHEQTKLIQRVRKIVRARWTVHAGVKVRLGGKVELEEIFGKLRLARREPEL